MTIAAARRRADRDEHGIDALDRRGQVGREAQPAGAHIVGDQRVQARFVDRHLAAIDALDLARVLVDADDGGAELREASPRDQADIARPDDRDAH